MEKKESNNIYAVGVNTYIRNSVQKNYVSEMNIGRLSLFAYNMCYFRSVLDSLKLKSDKDTFVFNTICSLAFLDSYKIVSNRIKKNTASQFDI